MPTTTTTMGADLRARRGRLGVTRAELAGMAGCSMTWLGNIEAGYVPKNSPALDRALAALEALEQTRSENSEAPAATPRPRIKSANAVAARGEE